MNAVNTRKVLDAHGIKSPRSIIIAQDPTMSRRTVASFEQVYIDKAPRLYGWPTFIPQVTIKTKSEDSDILSWIDFSNEIAGLWSMKRFVDLLMGEIPRMRDDENGYGPNGKGSIAHVDIPPEIEDAWRRLRGILGDTMRTRGDSAKN